MNAPIIPVFDGHNDMLLRLVRSQANESGPDYSFFTENPTGHLACRAPARAVLPAGSSPFSPPPRPTLRSASTVGAAA